MLPLPRRGAGCSRLRRLGSFTASPVPRSSWGLYFHRVSTAAVPISYQWPYRGSVPAAMRRGGNPDDPDASLRTADFHRVWFSEPAAADRPREIHRVVAVSFPPDWRGNRMGDVPVLALKERHYGR
jgi:hypothetical protein